MTDTVPLWDADADGTLICRQVRDETHDVKTFVFSAPEPRLFRFHPGQFLTWSFPVDGQEVNRCYTIASSPARPETVAITVKRVPGGVVSPWLHATMRPGAAVQATGPMGLFYPSPAPAGKFLFLSGGSGITPLMSMARAVDDRAGDADILFVHSARSPADIVFRAELALLARHRAGFRAVPICEADSPDEAWPGFRGRLSLPMLRLICPDLAERQVFCCGPAPYMAAVRAMLAEAGFDATHYHEESFDFDSGEPTGAETVAEATQGFSVQFTRSKRGVVCGPDSFILDAAKAAGLRLASSCTKGVCGTCKSKLVSGRVDMTHGGGIRQREIDQGMILICCARPLTDLVIEK